MGSANGFRCLGQRGHGFDDEQIDSNAWATFGERSYLLGEGGAGFV
jgi:hypothetical protein